MYASYSLTKSLVVFNVIIMLADTSMDGLCYGGCYVCKIHKVIKIKWESIAMLHVAGMFW